MKAVKQDNVLPQTHIVNGFEVPAPHREELKVGDWYFRPETFYGGEFCEEERWSGGSYDLWALNHGLVFLRKEDAIANSKARLGIDPYKEVMNEIAEQDCVRSKK